MQSFAEIAGELDKKFIDEYNKLDAMLYRKPTPKEKTWLSDNDLSQEVLIYQSQPRELEAKIELRQRAFGAIHAAYLTYRSQNKVDSKDLEFFHGGLFLLYKHFLKLLEEQSDLDNPLNYNKFLQERLLGEFVPYVCQRMCKKLKIDEDKGKTLLAHDFAAFANWERLSNTELGKHGFAVVRDLDGGGKKINLAIPENSNLTEAQMQEFRDLNNPKKTKPEWFRQLPKQSQNWLKLRGNDIANGKFLSQPSTLRFIPGLANVVSDTLLFVDSDEGKTFMTSANRSSVSTMDFTGNAVELQRITEMNSDQSVRYASKMRNSGRYQNHSVLRARYLSPLFLEKIPLIGRLFGDDNNSRLLKMSRDTNKNKDDLFSNWPINSVRLVAANPFKDKENIKTREHLDDLFKQKLIDIPEGTLQLNEHGYNLRSCLTEEGELTVNDLDQLSERVNNSGQSKQLKFTVMAMAKYQEIWEKAGEVDNPHGLNINLLMAALESIISEGLGLLVDHGCKHAVDRLAVVEMQKNALLEFMNKENRAPNLSEQDDVKALATSFAKEFSTNGGYHQSVKSIWSSYGAKGLQNGVGKTAGIVGLLNRIKANLGDQWFPRMIPKPYVEAIGEQQSSEQTYQVGLNEIDRLHEVAKTSSFPSFRKVKTPSKTSKNNTNPLKFSDVTSNISEEVNVFLGQEPQPPKQSEIHSSGDVNQKNAYAWEQQRKTSNSGVDYSQSAALSRLSLGFRV